MTTAVPQPECIGIRHDPFRPAPPPIIKRFTQCRPTKTGWRCLDEAGVVNEILCWPGPKRFHIADWLSFPVVDDAGVIVGAATIAYAPKKPRASRVSKERPDGSADALRR